LPATFSQLDLIERSESWARDNDAEFNEGLLSEWMKQDLVPEGDREGNDGRRPVYRYGNGHYRRILRLIRFRKRGIKHPDAIVVQLFLHGYGVKPHEVREPLVREFVKGRSKLIAMPRSKRIDVIGPIPPKHKASLIRSLGVADPRLADSGLVPNGDGLIVAIRAAVAADPESSARKPSFENEKLIGANLFVSFFGGILSDDPDLPSDIETMVASAPDKAIEAGRNTISLVKGVWNDLSTREEVTTFGARDAFSQAFRQREFASFLIIVGMILNETGVDTIEKLGGIF